MYKTQAFVRSNVLEAQAALDMWLANHPDYAVVSMVGTENLISGTHPYTSYTILILYTI